ncbi:MAG: hypothetical protein KJO55_02960 [Gammaproteobacteria bacterium]|nr:hypothetical protein [Gammaproteobacteria bacterium]
MSEPAQANWWGVFSLPPEQWSQWQIGPLSLSARATSNEWRLAWQQHDDADAPEVVTAIPAQHEPDLETVELARFAVENPGQDLRLTPRLADLPFVVRPETPLWIPPDQCALLYVGTVVWVAISQTGDDAPTLLELPLFRPSDTWFGANTRFGELCYASLTRARTRPDLLGRLPHRAITPVEINNAGPDMLNVEQLRIPVTALNLFESTEGQLWTDAIRFTRKQGLNNAEFDIIGASSHLPAGSQHLAEPRMPLQRNTVIQAFSSLFQ